MLVSVLMSGVAVRRNEKAAPEDGCRRTWMSPRALRMMMMLARSKLVQMRHADDCARFDAAIVNQAGRERRRMCIKLCINLCTDGGRSRKLLGMAGCFGG